MERPTTVLVVKQLKNKFLAGIGLGVLIFLAFTIYNGYQETVDAFKLFNWYYLPVVLLLAFGNYVSRFFKWEYYLRILNIEIPKRESFKIFFSGLAMSITPGKFGELLKTYLLKKTNGTPIAYSAPIVMAERLTDLLSLLVLSMIGVFAYAFGLKVVIIVSLVCLAFIFVIGSRSLSMKIIGWFELIPRIGKYAHKLEEFYESCARLIALKPLIVATFISVIAWLCECIGFHLTIFGFAQSEPEAFRSIFIYSFSTIAGAVTMSPGGIGLTEVSMAKFLEAGGLSFNLASAATWIIRVCTLWFAVVLGSLFLIFGKVDVEDVLQGDDEVVKRS